MMSELSTGKCNWCEKSFYFVLLHLHPLCEHGTLNQCQLVLSRQNPYNVSVSCSINYPYICFCHLLVCLKIMYQILPVKGWIIIIE